MHRLHTRSNQFIQVSLNKGTGRTKQTQTVNQSGKAIPTKIEKKKKSPNLHTMRRLGNSGSNINTAQETGQDHCFPPPLTPTYVTRTQWGSVHDKPISFYLTKVVRPCGHVYRCR